MDTTTPEIVALAMIIGVFLIGLVFIRQVRRIKTIYITARPLRCTLGLGLGFGLGFGLWCDLAGSVSLASRLATIDVIGLE